MENRPCLNPGGDVRLLNVIHWIKSIGKQSRWLKNWYLTALTPVFGFAVFMTVAICYYNWGAAPERNISLVMIPWSCAAFIAGMNFSDDMSDVHATRLREHIESINIEWRKSLAETFVQKCRVRELERENAALKTQLEDIEAENERQRLMA